MGIELSKEELDALVYAALNLGELRAGRNSPDNVELDTAESLTKKGLLTRAQKPSKRRTWWVFRIAPKGYAHLIELEKSGFSISGDPINNHRMDKAEIRKKMNTGTITHDEFEEYKDIIFSIIKENFYIAEDIPGTGIVIYKDANGNPLKINEERKELLIDAMSKYSTDMIPVTELHKCIFELGMCMEVCHMLISLIRDSVRLKTIYDQILSGIDKQDIEDMQAVDKSKLN